MYRDDGGDESCDEKLQQTCWMEVLALVSLVDIEKVDCLTTCSLRLNSFYVAIVFYKKQSTNLCMCTVKVEKKNCMKPQTDY